MDIVNKLTELEGLAPWNTKESYSFSGNTLLDLWGNHSTDVVEVVRVLENSGTKPTTSNNTCCVTAGSGPIIEASKPLLRYVDGIASPVVLNGTITDIVIPPGRYIFRFSGQGFSTKTTRLTAETTVRTPFDSMA